jgi:NADH-quinone oxidoreductase subunit M
MFFGEFWSRDPQWKEALTDLNLREYLMLVPLLVAFVALGIFPQYLMEYLNPAVERLTEWVAGR